MCACDEATAFLFEEARRLDEGDLDSWLELLTDDVSYQMPVRSTRYKRDGSEFSATAFVFDEDLFSLRARAARLHSKFAWSDDPRPRCRHFVSNVIAVPAAAATPADHGTAADEFEVRSSVLLMRCRADDRVPELLSAERRDVLRRTPAGLRLHRRTVLTDQTVLSMSSLTTLL